VSHAIQFAWHCPLSRVRTQIAPRDEEVGMMLFGRSAASPVCDGEVRMIRALASITTRPIAANVGGAEAVGPALIEP
jgi:hypothetical protein